MAHRFRRTTTALAAAMPLLAAAACGNGSNPASEAPAGPGHVVGQLTVLYGVNERGMPGNKGSEWWDPDDVRVQCWPDRLALTAVKAEQQPFEITVRADNAVAIRQGQQHADSLANTGQHADNTWQLQASSQAVVWRHNNKDATALTVTGTVQCGQAPPAPPSTSSY